MAASEKVLELVERFQRNLDVYKHAEYKETQVRVEFIDPFFEALGWDVRNVAGLAEQYKDVIHEDALKVSGATRAPDYCFRVGGTRKFFVEAKRPSAALKGDVGPAYQLRRYAWSAKLPLSILTDFEEFAVYDCRQRPKPADKASVGRVMYYTFDQYPDHLDDISAVFAKESVLKGSFDRYVQESKQKRGTGEVDAEFLKEIEGWREALARNVALRNPGLSVHELNDAVQRTIDRIIFLRICEDRGIEAYGRLMELTQPPAGSEPAGGSGSIYPRLVELYRQADQKYNAGLFDFQADTLTKTLAVDDRVLKPILADLYYPQSPYEFSVLPADILGQVYEQFLGKVIRLTPAHRAVVEEKPEVKKAGGVYYTPTYIVDTIVRQTVGKLVEGKTPRQLAGSARTAPLRILDPACGSGSFLLGAYQYLLDTHLHWYETNDPEKHARGRDPAIHRAPSPSQGEGRGGGWRLTTAEKKRILLTHIYGVDIDHQAVEVTKLSLLLKVLEGEQQVSFWSERVLPNLGDNVKCGNSLIGPDYYEGRQMGLFDDEELRRVNAFDWQAEFPQAMAAGGFDAVIGNPPWLMAGYYVSDEVLAYLRRKFETAKGKFDLYYPFIEQGCHLVSHSGLFGMIMPNKFFHTKAALNLRAFLSEPKWIRGIVDFGHERIFANATNYSCILFLRKQPGPNPKYTEAKAGLLTAKEFDVPWSAFSSDTWHFEDSKTRDIFKKLDEIGEPLEQITARFGTGVQSGADRLLAVDRDLAKAQLESELLRPVLRGRDVRRYMLSDNSKLLIFPYKVQAGKFVILSEAELQEYKNVYALLSKNRKRLAKRVWFSKSATELSGKWYGMMYLDSYHSFAAPHILTPSLSNHSNFALGEGDIFATGTAGVTSIIPKEDIKEAILYLLGVLNSNLISFYAVGHSPVFSGGYYKFSAPYLKKLPIRCINFDDPADAALHDKMVELVACMLDLHQRLAAAATPADKRLYQRQIDATDTQINALVYALYGLTEEEIAIVEGS